MSANFTPVFGGYRQPGAFKFWCQKVLPLVYDDSLSYYELLCKVVDYINNLIHDNSETIDNMDALLTAYNQLQDYVNNYFANLDLTGEVSNKIDEMVEDGDLLAIIQPTLDAMGQYLVDQSTAQQTYNEETRADVTASIASQIAYNTQTRTQVGNSINEQTAYNERTREIAQAMVGHPFTANTSSDMTDQTKVYVYTGTTSGSFVNGHWYYYNNGWVDGGVYNSQALSTDKSLTLEDNAADARYTGLRINAITDALQWRDGIAVSTQYGTERSDNGHVSTTKFTLVNPLSLVGVDRIGFYNDGVINYGTGYLHLYELNSTVYIGFCYILNGSFSYQSANASYPTLPDMAMSAIVDIIKSDWNAIYSDSWTNAIRLVKVQTDKSLTAMNIPADSDAVGREITVIKTDLSELEDDLSDVVGLLEFTWEQGGMASSTGIEYSSTSNVRTEFKAVSGTKITVWNRNTSGTNVAIYEFASNQTTTSGTNQRLAITYVVPNTSKEITLNQDTKYIRCQVPSGDINDGQKLLVCILDSLIANDYNSKIASNTAAIVTNTAAIVANKKNNLARNFILVDDTVKSGEANTYIDRLSAIHSIKLIGFEGYEMCRLRFICRNNATYNYRFIICGYDGVSWADIFDTLNNFTLTENAKGDTEVVCTINNKTVIMYIDYSAMMSDGTSWFLDLPTDPYRYIISPEAYLSGIKYANKLYAKYSSNTLSIITKYSDSELVKIDFYPYGVNGLFSPHKISRKTGSELIPDFTGFTVWQTINTDIVAPYAGLIDTAYPTTSMMTVGGNHGTDGAGGFPTATRLSYDIYVDGKKMANGDVLGGSTVHVIVKTNVAASNTIDTETGDFTPALEETATWIVTPQNIEVNVLLKALTDISILGYTGMQASCESYNSVYFNDGTSEKSITGVRIDSATYPGYSGERAIMTTANNDVYALYTNRSVGLGDLSHLANNTPVAFVSAYNKLYQHLIKSSPLNLDENETAIYSGGFTIMQSYPCTGAKSAYFIKFGDDKIYCVDFLTNGSCVVGLPIDCVGKQVVVVEKSDSVSIAQIVTGGGLLVSANGIGTVKFRLT